MKHIKFRVKIQCEICGDDIKDLLHNDLSHDLCREEQRELEPYSLFNGKVSQAIKRDEVIVKYMLLKSRQYCSLKNIEPHT